MGTNHVTVVDYQHLSDAVIVDPDQEIKTFIGGMGIKNAFPVVARLNFTIRNLKFGNITEELAFWFGSQSPQVNLYQEKIHKAYPTEEHGSLRILNIWSNLRLLELILQNVEGMEQEYEDHIISERLLKAYLLINLTYVRSSKAKKIMDSIPDGVGVLPKTAITIATMLMAYHDLNHIDPNDAFLVHYIKAIYFFQFAERELPMLLEKFLESYGVKTWREYLIALLPIANHALQGNKEGLGYLNIEKEKPSYEVAKKFLSMLSVGGQGTEDPEVDFILLRSKPLMKVNENRFLVIDNLLVYNKIYNSLYFEFSNLLKNDKSLFDKGDFKGFLNSYFSEDFLTRSVLDIIFKNDKFKRVSGSEIKKVHGKKFSAEPDYYVRDNEEIFIFELKDTFVKGDVKQSFSTGSIMEELKLKLWVKEVQKDGRVKSSPKAVQQLLNNIRRAVKNDLPFDDELGEKKLTIFPVLLYIDQSLSTPGINEIIQNWFGLEMHNDPIIKAASDRVHVMPLTMIDLDTLILFQDDFRDGRLDLAELIFYYWGYKRSLVEDGFQKKDFQIMTSGMIPFSAFIRMGRTERKAPDIFMEFGKLIFEKNS